MFLRILSTSLLLTSLVYSFISLDPPEIGEKEKLDAEIALSANISAGNTDTKSAGLAIKGQYNGEEWLTYLIAAYHYGEVNKDKNTNDGLAHLRYVHAIADTAYDYEFFLQSEFNEFQDIKKRNLAGANIRRKINLPFDKFYVGLGLFYSYLEPEAVSEFNPIYKQTKINSYISMSHNINEHFNITYLGFYQVTADDIADLRIFQILQLNTALTTHVGLSFDIKHEYNKTPYQNIEKNDIRSTISLKYKFN
ncbi:MAG: DUF481 domain-containing protein [Epsilonproteobacteria bacterium]|nr:DUF481 domain-containing protein [Campylobacterota bacterium]